MFVLKLLAIAGLFVLFRKILKKYILEKINKILNL